jgi:hypothetical protein
MHRRGKRGQSIEAENENVCQTEVRCCCSTATRFEAKQTVVWCSARNQNMQLDYRTTLNLDHLATVTTAAAAAAATVTTATMLHNHNCDEHPLYQWHECLLYTQR